MNLKKIFGLVLVGLLLYFPLLSRASSKRWYCEIHLFDAFCYFDQEGREIENSSTLWETGALITSSNMKFDRTRKSFKIKNAEYRSFSNDLSVVTYLHFKKIELSMENLYERHWKTILVLSMRETYAIEEWYQYSTETNKFKLVKLVARRTVNGG